MKMVVDIIIHKNGSRIITAENLHESEHVFNHLLKYCKKGRLLMENIIGWMIEKIFNYM